VWWKTFLDRLVKGSTKNILPDYQEKQKLLYKGNISHDELISYGDRYRKANRFFDALEFYQKAKHGPGLREIMAESNFLRRRDALRAGRQKRLGLRLPQRSGSGSADGPLP